MFSLQRLFLAAGFERPTLAKRPKTMRPLNSDHCLSPAPLKGSRLKRFPIDRIVKENHRSTRCSWPEQSGLFSRLITPAFVRFDSTSFTSGESHSNLIPTKVNRLLPKFLEIRGFFTARTSLRANSWG